MVVRTWQQDSRVRLEWCVRIQWDRVIRAGKPGAACQHPDDHGGETHRRDVSEAAGQTTHMLYPSEIRIPNKHWYRWQKTALWAIIGATRSVIFMNAQAKSEPRVVV
jgi:hypothetical protein